jgi:hypothetical protein
MTIGKEIIVSLFFRPKVSDPEEALLESPNTYEHLTN